MITLDLTFASADPAELDAVSEVVRAVCSHRTQILRSAGEDHRLHVSLKEPTDSPGARTDVAALLTVLPPLMGERSPARTAGPSAARSRREGEGAPQKVRSALPMC